MTINLEQTTYAVSLLYTEDEKDIDIAVHPIMHIQKTQRLFSYKQLLGDVNEIKMKEVLEKLKQKFPNEHFITIFPDSVIEVNEKL